MTLGERMKARRQALGMTQGDVARRAGLWPHDVWRFEAGRNEPKLDTLKALAEALEVSTDWLLGLPEPEPVSAGTGTEG